MSHAAISPGAPTIGPDGGPVGPEAAPDITIDVPTAVVTLSGPAPGIPVFVPAATVTLTGVGPSVAVSIHVPAVIVTLTGIGPDLTGGIRIEVPPGEISTVPARSQRPAILPANLHLYAKNTSGNWVEVHAVEWSVELDQALGQPTTATFTVQDRDGTLDEGFDFTVGRIPVILEIGGTGVASGFILFQGEWLYDTVQLPDGFPWRRHVLRATDYNRYLQRRLVGAPDGHHWETSDAGESYQPVDPEARTPLAGTTDRDTVRHLFETYWKGPITVDTDAFVTINRGTFGNHPIFWDRTTLSDAFEDLASRTTPRNIQYWLDMGDDPGKVFFHWIHIGPWWQQTGPQGMVRNPLELAPRNIDNDDPDYLTSIPVSGLEWSFDATGKVDEIYSNGWAAFAYNFDDPADPALFGGGWYPNEQAVFTGEQEYTDFVGPNMSEDVKINYGNRVLQRSGRALLRGSYTVTCTEPNRLRWHDLDDWHPGQKQTISDARMPDYLRGQTFAIQAVHSTLVKGTNIHRHVIDWGDAPRLRPFRFPAAKTPAKKPTRTMLVTWNVNTPIPGRTYKVEAQAVSEIGEPWAIQGAKVEWGLLVEDFAANVVTEGSIAVIGGGTTGATDSRGKAVAYVTIGARSDRIYTPIADFYP